MNKHLDAARAGSCLVLAAACIAIALSGSARGESPAAIKLLFLGDDGHHRPAERFLDLAPALESRGIELTYTDDMASLNTETLAPYDGLLVYANTTRIEPAQERALLEFVAGGKGFIPIHCASYCFLNSDKYVELVGAQFKSHGTGTFRTSIARPDHPVMKGFGGFESWDETYVHARHNDKDRAVLEYRVAGESREPWTWVRRHGEGRVFYTAWGHDQRTWRHPGFQNLVERGIRWAVGGDPADARSYTERAAFTPPEMTKLPADLPPFEYVDVGAKIPNYTPGRQWGTQGDPITKMQKPLPPEESLRHYVTPAGFEMRLFASEPELEGKPISMTWDERGRLWVCETVDYPNELRRSGEGRDRIRICEDTNGDGRADKFTVFAEELSIPTAIAFHKGGAIVQNGTETLYLKDTDGDGRADERRVLFSGWALGDTHGGVSNFRYGPDNWVWAMQGYNNSEPVVGGERQQGFRQGFFRFRITGDAAAEPIPAELEFIRSTNNNTWGLGISEEGIIFGSTANHNPSVYMPIPNRYYERVRGWSPRQLDTIADTHLFKPITDNIRQVDQHGGYTAGAGHALYTARTYPEQYWNRTAFVCGPTGHLVGTFVLNAGGADFSSTSPMNLAASDDEWSAPIMAEVGPDGNVWIIDWYNFIVQHNPTPQGFRTGRGAAYETDLRDKTHGRIYRLVYTGEDRGEAAEPISLADASPEKLVQTLRHENMFWRLHAQRLLVERGERDVVPALRKLVQDDSVDEIDLNVGAIHALWTLHGLGVLEPGRTDSSTLKALHAALRHPSPGVRRTAIAVVPRGKPVIVDEALRLLDDEDAQVRLAALLALADTDASDKAGKALAARLTDPKIIDDPWLSDAATSAAAAHARAFLYALPASHEEYGETPISLSANSIELVQAVAEHFARGRPDAESVQKLAVALVDPDLRLADAAVAGLSAGWPRDYTMSIDGNNDLAVLALLKRLPPARQAELVRLAMRWGNTSAEDYIAEITTSLLSAMSDEELPVERRIAAAEQLVELKPSDEESLAAVLKLVTPQAAPELSSGLIAALGEGDAALVGPLLVARLPAMTPAQKEAAFRLLLARPETTQALLDAAEEGKVALSELALVQRQALSSHPDRRIRGRAARLLERGGGLPSPDREKVLQELLPLAQQSGDAAAGKEVFKKQCIKCHTHSGEGTQIGPDLTGMAVHPKEELLTHIIDPSRSVEGNFRTYTVITADGRILSGMLAAETRTSIELIDAEAKRHAIPREDIDELVASTKSLMPDGFEKQVSREDIANLLEFLTQRGRYTPLDLRKVATIVSTRGMFYSEEAGAERLIFDDWSPKTFEGVPFVLVDPQRDRVPNVVMLHSENGKFPPTMPRRVELPVGQPAAAIHFLSGVAGWAAKQPQEEGTVSMIVRLHYADGESEDHPLYDGRHFADYIGPFEVPESKLAFRLRGQQIRYLAVRPKRAEKIDRLELIKGPDRTAPIVMAVTAEAPH